MERSELVKAVVSRLSTWKEAVYACVLSSPKPMDEEESKAFMVLSMSEAKIEEDEEVKNHFEVDSWSRLVILRARAINLDVSMAVLLMVGGYLTKSPGNAVLYLSFMRLHQLETGKRINMETFANLFPMGFIQESDLSKLWELQKGKDLPVDNMLDVIEAFTPV